MRGTLRRKKDKTRLVLFPHQVKIENALKSIKTVTELELTDRNVSKCLLSSNCFSHVAFVRTFSVGSYLVFYFH